MKVAIIGCGKIADEHAGALLKIPGCKIVGVCDTEELMAKQLAERNDIDNYFSDVQTMLDSVKPDAVHITTPPQSHFSLGSMALEAGANIFVEKPFTVTTEEAISLIEMAKSKNLKVTVGHNQQFSHEAMEMRELVKGGFLGGTPVHMESYFPYAIGNVYGQAFLTDKGHWVRALPGKLLHNVISHGICKIAEYIQDPEPDVTVVGYPSPLLRESGHADIIDELRVIITSKDRTTSAYFTFSSQISPGMYQFKLYGPENSIALDHNQRVLLKYRQTDSMKSYLNNFIAPRKLAKQYISNSNRNIRRFLKKKFHGDSGRRELFRLFYNAISTDGPVPIPYEEILRTSYIMDEIFSQLNDSAD
jgi:predicted dehydrogenase